MPNNGCRGINKNFNIRTRVSAPVSPSQFRKPVIVTIVVQNVGGRDCACSAKNLDRRQYVKAIRTSVYCEIFTIDTDLINKVPNGVLVFVLNSLLK